MREEILLQKALTAVESLRSASDTAEAEGALAAIEQTIRATRETLLQRRFQFRQSERQVWELRAKLADTVARLKRADRQLSAIQSSPAWRVAKPFWKLFGGHRLNHAAASSADHLTFGIDSPVELETSRDILLIEGWCFSRIGRRLAGIRAKIGRASYVAEYGLDRADVERTREDWPEARHSGFRVAIPVTAPTTLVRLEAIERGGEWQPFFEQQIARTGTPVAQSVPLPPSELMVAVAGHSDDAQFAESRISGPRQMMRDLRAAGVDPDDVRDVLDFGCGCGRLLAGWVMDSSPWHLSGCDYNSALVEWCNDNIPGVLVRENELGEILPFDTDSFDLVYLLSVFTHLTMPEQERLVSEFRRIVRPGGYIYVTFHGEHFYPRMFAQAEGGERRFRETGFLVGWDTVEGTNDCWTLHSPEALTRLFKGFKPLKHFKSTERGPTHVASWQDSMVFQAL